MEVIPLLEAIQEQRNRLIQLVQTTEQGFTDAQVYAQSCRLDELIVLYTQLVQHRKLEVRMRSADTRLLG